MDATTRLFLFGLTLLLVSAGLFARQAHLQAQTRTLDTLTKGNVGWTEPVATIRLIPALRTSPMTAKEWAQAYDECVKDDHMAPVILATRTPGVSAGITCLRRSDVE